MNRVINNPDLVVEDMLQGILAAHPELVAADGNPRVIQRACAPVAGKVGIVTGGGSGHEPAFLGYVGELWSTPSPSARSSPRPPPRASSTP
jgi:phosphoenolpyruvate---glycerone phosphotransferase subunit DhaK